MRHLTELAVESNDEIAAAVEVVEVVEADWSEAEVDETGLPRLFGRAVLDDFRAATGRHYLALAVMVAMLGFEWGPGNEVLIVSTLARVIDANPGWVGVPLVGLAGVALVGAVQLVTGSIGLVGFAMFERTAKASWIALQRFRKGEETADWWSLKLSTRWALAFFVGGSAVGLVQMVATGQTGWRTHRWVIAQSALLAGLTTGFIAALVAAATVTARQFPATEGAADTIISVASNPLTWIGLFAAVSIIGSIKSRFSTSADDSGD